MFLKLYRVILVALFTLRAVYALTVVLSPPVIDVLENSSVTLTCSSNETSDIKESRWGRTSNIFFAYVYYAPNGSCLTAGFIAESNKFDWSCYKNNTFSLTLKNVSRSEHGQKWKCVMNYVNSSNVSIYVKVPVESAKITSHLNETVPINENSSTEFQCHTGPGRPIPTLSWFLSNPDMKNIINITDASRQSPQAGDSINFTEVKSVLKYEFNRSHNGWHVYCQASNLAGRIVKSSSKLLFIVYPPDGGPTLTGIHDRGVLSIVEYQHGNMSCTVSGGNPPPNLTWHCFDGNVTESYKNGKVISNITWTVLRNQHNKSCTCVSGHTFGELNASVNVKVLYSPDEPTLRIQSESVQQMVEVIQNNSLNIICTSESNPISDYTWTKGSNLMAKGQNMTITRTQKNDSGEYECYVNNTMIGSNGLVTEGRNHSRITLHILFPPNNPTFKYIDDNWDNSVRGSSISVIKGATFTLLCQSASIPSPEYRWENKKSGNSSKVIAWTSVNKTCTATNTMIETVGERRNESASSTVFVDVLYSPTMPQINISRYTEMKVNVSDNVHVIEKTSFNLSCTSQGNPIPIYKWYINSIEIPTDQELMRFNISRHQSGIYSCKASNTMNRTFGGKEIDSNIRNITVDVLYPPNNPTFRYIDNTFNESVTGSVINVIKEDNFTMTCESVGHPLPRYIWENGAPGYASTIIAGRSVNKTCTATNTMTETLGESREESASSPLFVNVLYAPTKQQIYIQNNEGLKQNVSDSIRVIEKESLNLSCASQGNPFPIHKWYMDSRELSTDQTLVRLNISRRQSGLYTCTASNTMIRTFGKKGNGFRNSDITVDVLYPAEVGNLIDITVQEGDSLNITCPVIHGNHTQVTVKWTPDGALNSSDSTRLLYIPDISRNDEKLYKCSAKTLMEPTIGSQKTNTTFGQFQLTVNYKAHVTEFYIGSDINNNVYTVNETEDVTFTCSIDSKPAPTATIQLNHNIVYISDKSSFTYRREHIQCADLGLYECTGINEYNYGSQSVMNLTLYVNCSPRPSPYTTIKTNVTSARNTVATFSFTALAYPEPGPAGFIWSFMNGSDRMSLVNNTNVFIINTNMQSNLTMGDVKRENYGKYILTIKNTIGEFEQTFLLQPHGNVFKDLLISS